MNLNDFLELKTIYEFVQNSLTYADTTSNDYTINPKAPMTVTILDEDGLVVTKIDTIEPIQVTNIILNLMERSTRRLKDVLVFYSIVGKESDKTITVSSEHECVYDTRLYGDNDLKLKGFKYSESHQEVDDIVSIRVTCFEGTIDLDIRRRGTIVEV